MPEQVLPLDTAKAGMRTLKSRPEGRDVWVWALAVRLDHLTLLRSRGLRSGTRRCSRSAASGARAS